MDMEAVGPLAAEGGDQGGVDVDDGVGVDLKQFPGDDGHKARHHHQVDGQLLQFAHQSLGHGLTGGIIPAGQHIAGDAGFFGPLQGVGLRRGGDDGGNCSVDNLSPALGVDEGL